MGLSTTSKLRAVFDASAKTAKTSSGTSLNDILLVETTDHSPLLDVLIGFRLQENQRDLCWLVLRKNLKQPLIDYRMMRLTFGVLTSSFATNIAMRQNAIDNKESYPLAAQAVLDSSFVDDGLTGDDLEK